MSWKRLILLLGVLMFGIVGAPAQASEAGQPQGQAARDARISDTQQCSYEWRQKKVIRWVRRNGRPKRLVRYKKVRVRVCRSVPGPAPVRLGVKAWEFGFTLSSKQLPAGDTIVELNNQGEDAHDLHVKRLGGADELAAPETQPGGQSRIRFVTEPGGYRLWCSLPNHAAWGMDTTFQVEPQSGA